MNKLVLASLTGIAVLAIATPAFAYKGDPSVQGPNYSPERHEAMTVAFAKNDYQGWLKLMENKAWRLKDVVNSQSRFEEFVKARAKGVEGMQQFRAKYNLGTGSQNGSGYGRNR